MAASDPHGATAVITHQVRDAQHRDYEQWLTQILPLVREASGFLDVQIIRPLPGFTDTYTIILRFDCEDDLRSWLTSPARQRLIETVTPILAQGDSYSVHSGIDFLFEPQGKGHRTPVRWKQWLVTWSAIFPLTLLLPLALAPALRIAGVTSHVVVVFVVSAIAVFLMVYVIMPRYTRLVRRWLFR